MAKKRTATFTGPGQGLNYVGDHAYAYSGVLAIPANDLTTLLKFHTGKNGIFQVCSRKRLTVKFNT